MAEATPTRRDEPNRDRKTRRDQPRAGRPAKTRRDVPPDTPPATDTGGLPAPVFERYEPVRSLQSGGEAHLVMLARDWADGTLRVIKVYRSTIRPDETLLVALRQADPKHLVRIVDWGDHTDTYGTSVSWEVLEYLPDGSLRELIAAEGPRLAPDLVRAIVTQLAAALTHLHTEVRHGASTGLAHRDVKPENVLLRNRGKLDLVLCDFGLVAEIRATRISSKRAGTAEYQAPETWRRKSQEPAQDWWSLGVMVVEMLTGANPNAGVLRDAIDDEILFEHLTTHGVDLSGVDNSRWRMLCAGLLTFAPEHRWRGAQVADWLAGRSPEVHEGRSAFRTESPPVRPPVAAIEIGGHLCDDPAEVARVMSRDFPTACDVFAHRGQRLALSDWLADNFSDVALPKNLFRRDPDNQEDAAIRVISFISLVAPELRPNYRGRPMDAAGIAALAQAADTDPTATALLARLDARLLGPFARHRCAVHRQCEDRPDGCAVLASAATALGPARAELRQRAARLAVTPPVAGRSRLTQKDTATTDAALVRALVDPDYVAMLGKRLDRERLAGRCPWWAELRAEGGAGTATALPALVLAAATADLAIAGVAGEDATRSQERAAVRDLRRDQIRLGVRTTGRDLVNWSLTVLLAYATLLVSVYVVAATRSKVVPKPAQLAIEVVTVQTWLAFPVVVLLGCLLIRPNRPAMAGRRAVQTVLLLGAVVGGALAGRVGELLVFPIVWQTGVSDALAALYARFDASTSIYPVLAIAVTAMLVLTGTVRRSAARARPASRGGTGNAVRNTLIILVLLMFMVRAGQIWLGWHIPGLVTTTAVWLTI